MSPHIFVSWCYFKHKHSSCIYSIILFFPLLFLGKLHQIFLAWGLHRITRKPKLRICLLGITQSKMHNHKIRQLFRLLLFREACPSGTCSFHTTSLHSRRSLQPWAETERLSTSLQYLVTATPKGCSLLASAVPTTARTFFRESTAVSPSRSTLITLGTPQVMVPVLSNITVLICKKETTVTT